VTGELITPAWLDELIQRTLKRLREQRYRADEVTDDAARCLRVAELYAREARWWAVAVRHSHGFHNQLFWTAGIDAERLALRYAEDYRAIAADFQRIHDNARRRAAAATAVA
jgi:hypothetical protein